MIELEDVVKRFPGTEAPAVDHLTLSIPEGALVTLVGPSGCGKTTTLKMINRIIEPTSGRITIGGARADSVPAHVLRRSIGYVIQQIGLFPHRTIRENIATVPGLLGWDDGRIGDRVAELTELVGLETAMLERYPRELSGGQQQRVGVARALAADPPVLLMDEPFGAVDPIVRTHLQDQLEELQHRLGKTIVFVTHDIDEAIRLGDLMCILNTGGRIEQYGAPSDILSSPANGFVEDFLGGERGLRRLGLLPVEGAHLHAGPVVDIGAPVSSARDVMAAHGLDWVTVLDGETLLGWLSADDLAPASSLVDLRPRDFLVRLERTSSLRKALDAVVTGHARVAVVVDGSRYLGMLDLDAIAEEITE